MKNILSSKAPKEKNPLLVGRGNIRADERGESLIGYMISEIFFIPLWREHKVEIAKVIFSLIFLALGQSLLLLILGPFLKILFGLHSPSLQISAKDFISPTMIEFFPVLERFETSRSSMIYFVPITLLAAAFLKALATYVYQLSTSFISLYVAKVYRDKLFSGIMRLSYVQVMSNTPAQWMSQLMGDVLFLQTRFSEIVNTIVRDSTIFCAALITLCFIHWPTAVIVLVSSPFIAYGMGKTGKKISVFAEKFQKELSNIADFILEARKRFFFIKAQNAESYEVFRFSQINTHYFSLVKKSIFIRSIFAPLLEFIGFAILAFVIYLVGHGYFIQKTQSVNIVVFFATLGVMLRPLRNSGEQLVKWQETKGSLHKSFEVLRSLEDSSKNQTDVLKNLDAHLSPLQELHFDHIVSGFETDKPIIMGKNLSLKPGTAITLVGPSGSGKSTLLRTFSGLVKPFVWDATISIEEMTERSALISQMPFLFDDTLYDNLIYGNSKPPGISEIHQALRSVGIYDEVMAFDKALDTRIRVIGSNISGGQKQRLVIARTLLRGKSILLLDEITSAVDVASEKEILTHLISLCRQQGWILVSITHRLHTVEFFDSVWFVESGEIKQMGTHQQLLSHARYREFYESSL